MMYMYFYLNVVSHFHLCLYLYLNLYLNLKRNLFNPFQSNFMLLISSAWFNSIQFCCKISLLEINQSFSVLPFVLAREPEVKEVRTGEVSEEMDKMDKDKEVWTEEMDDVESNEDQNEEI